MGVLIFGDLEPDETIRVRFAIDGEYLVNEINERVALGIVRQNAGQVIARIAEPIRTDGLLSSVRPIAFARSPISPRSIPVLIAIPDRRDDAPW
jgi:hypothetical protein